MAPNNAGPTFKIRLEGGRVLGPLDLDRIAALVRKGHVRGNEQARRQPDGDWLPLAQHEELARLILNQGTAPIPELPQNERERLTVSIREAAAETKILGGTLVEASPANPTVVLPTGAFEPTTAGPVAIDPPTSADAAVAQPAKIEVETRGEAAEDRTVVASVLAYEENEISDVSISLNREPLPEQVDIASQQTVVFRRPGSAVGSSAAARQSLGRQRIRMILVAVATVLVGSEILDSLEPKSDRVAAVRVELRPRLPSAVEGRPDPMVSQKRYLEGLEFYRQDNLSNYRKAVRAFTRSVEADAGNVRALAMLASSYLNLIDVSNKDENYFSVIQKLIDLSRAKDLDLPETLLAEVEFLLFSQRPTAAQNKVIEYTKTHKNYDSIVLVYLAEAFLARGDFATAARYLAPLPDDRPYSVKVHYLRGRVAEALGDTEAAIQQYEKAIAGNRWHAWSRFRLSSLLETAGELKRARPHLEFLTRHADELPSRELAQALSWRAALDEADGKIDVALGHAERALQLESENPKFNLQFYLLRSRAGDAVPGVRREARLYYYLAEGERFAREGKADEAIVQFLDARRENPQSPLPLVKLGELFQNVKRDVVNARINLGKALQLAPRDARIGAKYIELLIQSYEWEEAAKIMARFKGQPVPAGIIDKLSGDWNARQGRHAQAQSEYRRAMSRQYIEPGVYLAYGRSLLATRNFDQAPFILSLALRQDPENLEAIQGTATALAGTEGIDRAMAYLREVMQKGRGTRAELLSTIAELLIQKGRLDLAAETLEQAKALRPDAPAPWRVEGQLALARGSDRKAREKAEQAYRAYLDRNPSDATVMYDLYRVLVDLERFEQADAMLGRIYESYPKFPSLHYSKGLIYMRMGNFKAAIAEFEGELKNGNGSTQNLIELGKANLEVQRIEPALQYFIQAMQKSPREAEPKFQAARANALLKRYDAAIALYQEALKIDSGNPLYYRSLGFAYRAAGDYPNMRWAFSKYLEMEPDAVDKGEIQKNL